MKLRIIWIGKTKNQNLADLIKDFDSRVRRFLPLEIRELKDVKTSDGSRRIEEEGSRILSAIDDADRVIVLDAAGQLWNSRQFAAFVGKHLREDPRAITFVIGGYGGLAESVKQRADKMWSLSPLTFTHDLTRVLVLEQIYRALANLNNHPYSK